MVKGQIDKNRKNNIKLTKSKPNLVYILSASGFFEFEKVGFEKRLYDQFRETSKYYKNIFILSADTKSYQRDLPKNCQHNYIKFPNLLNKPIIRRIKLLIFLIFSPIIFRNKFKQADIIEARFIEGGVTGLIASKIYNKPVVLWFPWWWSDYFKDYSLLMSKLARKLECLIFKNADMVLVPTTELLNAIKSCTPKKIDYLVNFINTDLFQQKKSWKLREPIEIISIGSLIERKNHSVILNASALAKSESQKDIKVTFIGDGPLYGRLKNMAKELNMSLTIYRKMKNEKIPTFLRNSDIFIMASKKEGNPKALLEAMSCGLPCIGTNASGIKEVINHEENGILVSDNAKALSKKICHLIDNRKWRKKIGEKARRFIVEKYSLTNVIKNESKILNKIINDTPIDLKLSQGSIGTCLKEIIEMTVLLIIIICIDPLFIAWKYLKEIKQSIFEKGT